VKTDPIKRVVLKDGRVRYRLTIDVGTKPDGRRDQRTFTFDSLREARAERGRIISERARGIYVKPSKTTVAEICSAWLAGKRNLAVNTRRTYSDALGLVTARVGHITALEFNKRQLDEAVNDMLTNGRRVGTRKSRKLSARTVNVALNCLSAALDSAVRDGTLVRNVVHLIDRPKERKEEITTWAPEHAAEFLASVASDRLAVAWQLSLYGLRRSEVLGLRWSDIDLEARTLTVNWKRVVTAGDLVEDDPKTPKSQRTLPLDDDLVRALTSCQVKQLEEQQAAGEAYQTCPLCDGAHVVANELGQPYHPQYYSDLFTRLVNAAGLPLIRLHDTRHTCGTLMHLRGVPVAVISAWLGHASADFTMRTYVHSQPAELETAVLTLRKALTCTSGQG
jgi:integrase